MTTNQTASPSDNDGLSPTSVTVTLDHTEIVQERLPTKESETSQKQVIKLTDIAT